MSALRTPLELAWCVLAVLLLLVGGSRVVVLPFQYTPCWFTQPHLIAVSRALCRASLVSRVRGSFHKDVENRRHAALQILAIDTAIAVVCAVPDNDFDIFSFSMNF